MPNRFFHILVFASLLIAGPAVAHDFWIEASDYRPAPGAEVALSWRVGVGFKGDSLPYITEWIDDFSVVTESGREPIKSIVGNDPAARLRATDAPMLIGYQSKRSFVELEPEKFNDYLREEGMEYVLQQRQDRDEADKPAPEYFVRCVKALIAGARGAGPFDTRLSYTLELIPQSDPYAARVGDELIFKLLYLGKPIQGILVQSLSRDNPDQRSASRTDSEGRARLRFAEPSVYLVKAVHMVPLENSKKARWESFWASYTFEVTARP